VLASDRAACDGPFVSKPRPEILTEAAAALEAELRRYEELAAAAAAVPLTSGKNLDRAARAAAEAADSQDRVAVRVGALVQVIAAAREQQQATAEGLARRALEIQARTRVFQTLLDAFGSLGNDAKGINELVERTAESSRDDAPPEARAEALPRLDEVLARMDDVADRASRLSARAEEEKMTDVARQAESLAQQLRSARNKLLILRRKLAGGAPN